MLAALDFRSLSMHTSIARARHFVSLARIVLAAFTAAALGAVAAPATDLSFGDGGRVRIGVPAAGFEENVSASTIQPDGKVVVAGTSVGRQSYTFVTRFTTAGQPDPAFGANGTILLGCGGLQVPLQLEAQADGSLWLVGSTADRLVVTRISESGGVDLFSCDGSAYQAIDLVGNRGAARLTFQPDGKQLIVSDASAAGNFALRLRRYQVGLPYGTPDTSLGPNGERLLSGLPVNFTFTSTRLAAPEPDGGFTLVANGVFPGSTYLVLRITRDGALDSSFGNGVGYVSGFDAGNPRDVPAQLVRAPDGEYVVFGYPVDVNGNPTGQLIAWKLDAQGRRVATFGMGGVLSLPGSYFAAQGAVLADATIAVASMPTLNEAPPDSSDLLVARYDAAGKPLSQFGTGGIATFPVAGYFLSNPVGVHTDASGRFHVAGTGYSRVVGFEVPGGVGSVARGADALVASLTSAGSPRQDFGRGDGLAIWNNPALSNDRLDAIRFGAQDRIVLVGYSDGSGTFNDYLLTRLNDNGAVDPTYGSNGRLYPHQFARFTGVARAAMGPDESIVVAGGEALGTAGTLRSVTIFRATANGTLDDNFHPGVAPAGPNAAVALGARSDGRIVYGTLDGGSAVLQQFLADGSPDTTFGTGGFAAFPLGTNPVTQGDLVVLPDGSVVFAVFLNDSVRIFKVDAHGVADVSFGTNGQVSEATPPFQPTGFAGPALLALADGTFIAAERVTLSSGSGGSPPVNALHVLRLSSTGQVIQAETLLTGEAFATFVLAALPDSSVLIARSIDDPGGRRSMLYRLLPDGDFDTSFGVPGYGLAMTQVNAMAIDRAGRLVVSGQDQSSAVVARYVLNAGIASVPVVEYFNTALGHYFVTANPAEQANIEADGAGPGWQRTGYGFRAFVPPSGVPVGAHAVCRFYGTSGIGPNSHFYTADAGECAAVKNDRGWTYEGTAFFIAVPANGQCGAGSSPVYRAYNNRFAQNDSNHRYTTDTAVYNAMLAQGWIGEGPVMCAAT
jgi:uncharacterized delta-60 repeat protein